MNENPLPQASASEPRAKQQFGLGAVFYLMAVYAAGMPFGLWTFILTTLILSAWWILLASKNKWLIGLIVSGFLLLVLLMPNVQQRRVHAVRRPSENDLRQLTLAMINYESVKGAFPPAYITDDTAKPIHSWRVLMLPNIGEDALYAKYDFDEPWDGPNNIKLLDQMPEGLSCRISDPPANLTPYKLVVDKGTPFEGGQTSSYGDIKDGSSNTIAVVEDLKNPVPWTKPEDLTIEQAVALLSSRELKNVPHVTQTHFTSKLYGPAVSSFDGSTHSIRPRANPTVIRNLCTHGDGKVVNIYLIDGPFTLVRGNRNIAWFVYVILLIAPGLVALKRKIASRHR